jgi:hypothetical protein
MHIRKRARRLTLKQQRWLDAYLGSAHGNATEAARIAGYSGNDVTLATVGYQNIRKYQISAAVADVLTRAALARDEVLKLISALARREAPDDFDPLRALIYIGKYHGLWDRHNRRLKKEANAIRREFHAILQATLDRNKQEFDITEFVAEAEERAESRLRQRRGTRGESPNGEV